ncbi:MAG: hypothetical protein EBY28_07895 [Betaproteobacteria bacterium]|nr:hypothetical protein [Betaproteobacteria bacterium]
MSGPIKDEGRDAALREASVPTLLMCLAQITGEDRWLQAPFLPRRDISIFAEPTGGLSTEAQQAIRSALSQVLDELSSGARQLPPTSTCNLRSRRWAFATGDSTGLRRPHPSVSPASVRW